MTSHYIVVSFILQKEKESLKTPALFLHNVLPTLDGIGRIKKFLEFTLACSSGSRKLSIFSILRQLVFLPRYIISKNTIFCFSTHSPLQH